LKAHIIITIDKILVSVQLKNEKTHSAIDPLRTTSKRDNIGIIDAKKYMLKIENNASEYVMLTSKSTNKK